ncbi:MFS transporter [Pseudonocardia acaciae]|uniref:MFS transporter n=1 Tax=Pseudonocardia acaciae TaxID=551276 RepID=UPI001FDF2996|nr:aromatic acid/H+ symport family MFS transporter [Pseudonocardia acaciae]
MTTAAHTSTTSGRGRRERLVLALCFAVILFDGYDLIVYGAAVPAILRYQPWGVTAVEAGAIGSYALVGMLLGALIAGRLTDVVGRRKIMLASITWFSLAMVGCALAPSPELFGLFRFLGGIGLGGAMPTTIALTTEYSPVHRRGLNNALMFSGYTVGGILAAALALVLMPTFGFRSVFWVGAAPLVLVVPPLLRYLPESVTFLAATGRRPGALELFSRRHRAPAALFAVVSFVGLLLIYGLNTWLPQIMKSAGYSLSSSLLFLVMLNLGAMIGTVVAAPLGDRIGMKPVTVVAFGTAAVSIFLLSLPIPELPRYAVAALAGFGTIGTQILVNAHIAIHFPDAIRATALGLALGVGRLGAIAGPAFGGLLIAHGVSTAWNFYAFAIPALLGVALAALLPARTPDWTRPT